MNRRSPSPGRQRGGGRPQSLLRAHFAEDTSNYVRCWYCCKLATNKLDRMKKHLEKCIQFNQRSTSTENASTSMLGTIGETTGSIHVDEEVEMITSVSSGPTALIGRPSTELSAGAGTTDIYTTIFVHIEKLALN